MKKARVYDKAKYHSGGNFPKDLKEYQAYVHTGMFVAWLIEHDMISAEFAAETARFRSGELTGTQVYELWDGALVDDMLTDEGNRFAESYFDFQSGQFLKDYEEVFPNAPTLYHVEDTRANYERIRDRINQRYEAWKKSPPPNQSPEPTAVTPSVPPSRPTSFVRRWLSFLR
jgi:hypothetical protein